MCPGRGEGDGFPVTQVNIREAAIECNPATMRHSSRSWPALINNTSLSPLITASSRAQAFFLALPRPLPPLPPHTHLKLGQDSVGVCVGILLQCEQAGLRQPLGPLLQGGEEEEEGGEGKGVGITLSVNRQVFASRLAPSCRGGGS